MQRRITQRSSNAKNYGLPYARPGITDGGNEKNKGRKLSPKLLLYCVVLFFIVIYCIGTLLTPSQKNELADAEHQLEDWLQNRNGPAPQEEKPRKSKLDDRGTPEQGTAAEAVHEEPKQDEAADPQENAAAKPNRASHGAAPSSGWVDREKELKKKLKVLYDQHAEGKNLGVPVLTRYLGEDIPAFIGTPDSTMKEEEWKKLVEDKYKEMREEEDAWQKKMALLIEKRERDIGITTP